MVWFEGLDGLRNLNFIHLLYGWYALCKVYFTPLMAVTKFRLWLGWISRVLFSLNCKAKGNTDIFICTESRWKRRFLPINKEIRVWSSIVIVPFRFNPILSLINFQAEWYTRCLDALNNIEKLYHGKETADIIQSKVMQVQNSLLLK